jgi:hypothetical protein
MGSVGLFCSSASYSLEGLKWRDLKWGPAIMMERSSASARKMMLFRFATPQYPSMRSQSNATLEVDTAIVGSFYYDGGK